LSRPAHAGQLGALHTGGSWSLAADFGAVGCDRSSAPSDVAIWRRLFIAKPIKSGIGGLNSRRAEDALARTQQKPHTEFCTTKPKLYQVFVMVFFLHWGPRSAGIRLANKGEKQRLSQRLDYSAGWPWTIKSSPPKIYQHNQTCSLCNACPEDAQHILTQCTVTKDVL
jgi:hypothetical protein